VLAPTSVVQTAELMVACEVSERRRAERGPTRIRVASRIEPEWLLELFPDRVVDFEEAVFDAARERVDLRRGLSYDGLVLDETVVAGARGPAVTRALVEAALDAGPGRFADPDELDALHRRLAFAAELDPTMPTLEPQVVRGTLERLCDGASSFVEIESAGLLQLLRAELGADVLARLSALAPALLPLPGRPSGTPVHYEPDRPPWIESYLQDFFGLADGPRVGGGRVPVVLHLLAPNARAVQVTTDLAGFWDRHYPRLAKELGRRYPKHHFPDDPRRAEPRRLKRRR
jgi:ATP-dependent helicase HrpB